MSFYYQRMSIAALLTTLFLLTIPMVSLAHHPESTTPFKTEESMQVPGKTLNANTGYMLKVLQADGDRHMVQILSGDQSQVVTTFLGVSDEMNAKGKMGFTFTGSPKAVLAWSDPEWGRLNFAYSAEEARKIAQRSSEPVFSTNARVTANQTDLSSIQVATVQPGRAGQSETQVARAEGVDNGLPGTAGETPLLGLIGLALLSLALVFRVRRSHT